jgi:hypothetical protein
MAELQYPRDLQSLAQYINLPRFPLALRQFLHAFFHPNVDIPANPAELLKFNEKISVFHSAIARFYAPSDLCGGGGMSRETIWSNSNWHGAPRYDTVFVALNDEPGMPGMVVARVLLFFSFCFRRREFKCALVNWFIRKANEPHPDTRMWEVHLEKENGVCTLEIIHIDSIVRGAHLLPVFGSGKLPQSLGFQSSLDSFDVYFINQYADHHVHELITS